MSSLAHEVRAGAYYDSVVLMQLQRALAALPQVQDAGVVMATGANLELLEQSDLLPPGAQAGADDLLIVVRATSQTGAKQALSMVDQLLSRRRAAVDQAYRPRSLQAAARALPQSRWVTISVPGRYAAAVAHQALDLGRHVFLYSDNVSLEDERALKLRARGLDRLVMGPDCGTAIINGIGLGFANHVRRGSIGLVGASGTGLQAITSEIHRMGAGISHALGTGGRDLKSEIGGISALQSLATLAEDPETRVMVLVSKPPDPQVSQRVLAGAVAWGKPTVVNFIGYPAPFGTLGNLHFVNSLAEAAERAVELAGSDAAVSRAWLHPGGSLPIQGQGRRYLRGLFAGGTLAGEAQRGLAALLGPIHSNLVGEGSLPLQDPLHSQGHTLLDLGEDLFTVGRLHPMMDNDLRLRRLRQEAADPEVGLILLDVVLGEAAHPDPAAELGPAIASIREKREIELVVLLVGTEEDPQDLQHQQEQLERAGAAVYRDTGGAIAHAIARLGVHPPAEARSVGIASLAEPVAAINVGLESFYTSLISQGASAVQVDWRPPAGGDEKLMAVLERMKRAQ